MPGKLHRLTYVHAGDPGPIGAAIEAGGRLLHFGTEGSGLFGLSVDEKGQPSIANARALAVRIDVKGLDELPADVRAVVGDQVPCVLGQSGTEFAVIVAPASLGRTSANLSDLRGKVRYGLARIGWTID